ncbi:MAG: hypothetical protein A2015_05840 [Spirochaetes bacterium GWF1_31_7]|nr:MAG: hypothetical protein A2Y30_07870 [Spirochaetes bacterium GWE1_32_154]OHD50779.1 MAG: hypothetical protein A2Y29_02470 [Spirochaetes bacterium GWE2_31_10]OHD52716.1 MAG: hypothetical protein A2015_05840 [Spirochaetes bacterium GWF1_31_7]HBD95390.1 hypothetical protein [Spirochaetia bacterium]HBI36346.1 hypothetical protein [Spirochaetia bacterium]
MRMPEKIDDYFFAPCGVNCFVCYVHLKVKKPCNGCYGSDDNKPERCKNCTIKQCVSNKSLQYCFECNDYPCQLIKNLEKSYTKRYNVSIMANSEMVKKYGVSEFQQTEVVKWKCSTCGGVITQHGMYCSECE